MEVMPLDDVRPDNLHSTGQAAAPDGNGVSDADFAGMATSLGELQDPIEAGLGMTQSLPFSASEMNLANFASWASPSRAAFGDPTGDLTGIPRNFSLSDLSFDHLGPSDSDHALNSMQHDIPHELAHIPRNFSMS